MIANPLDDEALFGALASPACGVLPDTLWLLRRAATVHGDDGRERSATSGPGQGPGRERRGRARGRRGGGADPGGGAASGCERFAGVLGELRGHSHRGRAGGARRADGDLVRLRPRHPDARRRHRALGERPQADAAGAGVRGARGARPARLPRLPRGRAPSSATARPRRPTRAEGHAGVRVMTVHAREGPRVRRGRGRGPRPQPAAGLDPRSAGRVPVLRRARRAASWRGSASSSGASAGRPSASRDYQELTELAAERDAEEEARLAYVAATRAKRRLLLSGTFNPNALTKDDRRAQADRAAADPLPARRRRRRARASSCPPRGDGFPAGRLLRQGQRAGPRSRRRAARARGDPTRAPEPSAERRTRRCPGPRSPPRWSAGSPTRRSRATRTAATASTSSACSGSASPS